MQNRYTGDIGDFGKLGLLRALRASGLSIGVNWYLVPDEGHNNDGKHTKYPELKEGALNGRKRMYIPSTAADCCEDTSAVEAFDATFPPKEKKWMPSQEEFYIYRHSSVVR